SGKSPESSGPRDSNGPTKATATCSYPTNGRVSSSPTSTSTSGDSNPKPPPKGPPHTDVAGLSCTRKAAMNPDQPVTELFTQPGCMPCKAVERKLVQYSIPYIVHDI